MRIFGVGPDAFRARGADAVSCDLLPSEQAGPHIHGDVIDHLSDGWDLAVFIHPVHAWRQVARGGLRDVKPNKRKPSPLFAPSSPPRYQR